MRVTSHTCSNSSQSPLNSCMYISEPEILRTRVDEVFCDSNDGENVNYSRSWAQVTPTAEADASSTRFQKDDSIDFEDDTQFDTLSCGPLRDNNAKKFFAPFKHVPSRQKPPQQVAKRNLRERNRVQAVNTAFNRLRKAVPIQHARGKRISKVKTLQNAINYIKGLEELLNDEYFPPFSAMEYCSPKNDIIWWDFEC